MQATRELQRRDRLAAGVRRRCWSLGLACLAAACGGGTPAPVEAPSAAGASSSAAPEAALPRGSSASVGAADPAPAATASAAAAAPASDWREHELVAFGGRLRAKVFASGPASVEREREADAEGSARATLKVPIGEIRAIDCHLRAARLSAVEAVAGVAKLVAEQRATAIQASVSYVGERLVLRYALEVDEPNGGARVGTIRVAMAIGESDTALCSHLGGDDGTAFEASTASLFRGLGGIAEKPADYVDIVWVHGSTQTGSPLDVEHRLRARTPASGGPAEELGVSLTASIDEGELLVTETVSGLRIDATNEVTEATIATRDSRGSSVDVGVVRRAPKSYVMRVLVGGRDQMAPVSTSSPLTTELSLTPKIAAARRGRASGRAELRWTELLPVGLGREVSVIQTRRLVAMPGGVDLHVEGSEPARWGCTADDAGALLLCQLRAQSSLLTRSRVHARP